MARQPNESHKRKHKDKDMGEAAETQAHRKPRKSYHSHSHRSKNATQDASKLPEAVKEPSKFQKPARPAKDPEGIKNASKVKKTASAAGVFKRAKHDDEKHRKRKDRVSTPEPSLTEILREGIAEGIEDARATIDKTLRATFEAEHEELLHQLSESREADVKFFESISTAAHTLGLPLGEEQIEITFTRDGKRVTEIVEIGKRIGLFKKSVEKDEAKLKAYWKDWEALQGDFVELGIDVFGPEMFGQAAKDARGRGFVKEMEVTDEEHDGRMGGLAAEVEEMAEGVLARMKESEKELDASAREQQTRLLQALLSE